MGMFFRLMSYVYENRIYAGTEVSLDGEKVRPARQLY